MSEAVLRQAFLADLKLKLEKLGFSQTSDIPPMFEMIDEDKIVRFYPGVSKLKGLVVLRPVIAADNSKLRSIFQAVEGPLNKTHSIAHAYLSSLDDWESLRLDALSDVGPVCDQIINTLRGRAIPLLQPFLSVQGAEGLFEADLNHAAPIGLAVMFSQQKLALLREARLTGKLP